MRREMLTFGATGCVWPHREATLHVESVGQGPPIVLLHGWGMHAGMWGPLHARLARAHRVHAVDLPGHGHSNTDTGSLRDVVAALSAQFADVGSGIAVLGWSLGAIVAMQWALAAPVQVQRLLLTGATPWFVKDDGWSHGIEELALRHFGDELRASYKLTLQRFLSLQLQGGIDGRNTLCRLRNVLFARGAPSPVALAEGLELLRSTDLRQRVDEIAQPTLVIAGDRDTLTPVGASRWLVAKLPRARLVIIPGAAHVPFLSHAEAFAVAAEQFLHEA